MLWQGVCVWGGGCLMHALHPCMLYVLCTVNPL
jgi:hypothetical protein